jgi:glyoxylase-like metal-dependent hydrolase (beta-lactamase superfamily II)
MSERARPSVFVDPIRHAMEAEMTTLDRRQFFRLGAGSALACAGGVSAFLDGPSPSPLGALAPSSEEIGAGFFRYQLGDFRITVVSDGHFGLPAELFGANVTAERRASYFESRMLPSDAIRLPSSPLVIETGSRVVLVDAGSGEADDPAVSTGRLMESLAAASIDPGAIDLVVLTHAHGDHIGGLVDPGTMAPVFPDAEVVVSETEYELWMADDVRSRVPAWVGEWGIIEPTRAAFAALGDRVRTVPVAGEVAAGIHGISTPGHTPGHMGLVVASGDEQMILAGDAIVNVHTHFEHPDWHLGVDHDPREGVRTRRRLLERIATDRVLVHGFHLPFPGIGHVVRAGEAYRWLPVA